MLRRATQTLKIAKMSTYTTDKASPFTRAVVSSMRKLSVITLVVLKMDKDLRRYFIIGIPKRWLRRAGITPDVSSSTIIVGKKLADKTLSTSRGSVRSNTAPDELGSSDYRPHESCRRRSDREKRLRCCLLS